MMRPDHTINRAFLMSAGTLILKGSLMPPKRPPNPKSSKPAKPARPGKPVTPAKVVPPPELGATIEVDLEDMAQGGAALGRYARKIVFVPYAIPGERVRAK